MGSSRLEQSTVHKLELIQALVVIIRANEYRAILMQ